MRVSWALTPFVYSPFCFDMCGLFLKVDLFIVRLRNKAVVAINNCVCVCMCVHACVHVPVFYMCAQYTYMYVLLVESGTMSRVHV